MSKDLIREKLNNNLQHFGNQFSAISFRFSFNLHIKPEQENPQNEGHWDIGYNDRFFWRQTHGDGLNAWEQSGATCGKDQWRVRARKLCQLKALPQDIPIPLNSSFYSVCNFNGKLMPNFDL